MNVCAWKSEPEKKKRAQDEGNKSNMKEGRKKGHVRTSTRMRAMFVCGILFLFTSCSRQHAPKPIMPRTRIIFKYSHSTADGVGVDSFALSRNPISSYCSSLNDILAHEWSLTTLLRCKWMMGFERRWLDDFDDVSDVFTAALIYASDSAHFDVN